MGRPGAMVLDEVQRALDLLLAVKRAVDERRIAGRYVLTGSANLLLQTTVSESLAGRASYLNLWPMTRRERLGLGVAGIWSRLMDSEVEDWQDALGPAADKEGDWVSEVLRGG